MSLFGWRAQAQAPVQSSTPTYCVGVCTCGQDCHTNLELHTQITGALTSDEWSEDKPCVLPEEVDDDLYERAMATLRAG